MNLHQYYRTQKDTINSSIMEIASDLAVGRMIETHSQLFEHFIESADPDDPDGETRYKPEYQDEYNKYFDEEYERLAALMKFDIGEDDGVRKTEQLTDRGLHIDISNETRYFIDVQKQFIVDILKKNGGAIHLNPDMDDEGCDEYPVSCTLYGKHDYPRINLTDVYLIDNGIYVDGVDDETGEKRTKFFVYPEHISDVFSFVGHILEY